MSMIQKLAAVAIASVLVAAPAWAAGAGSGGTGWAGPARAPQSPRARAEALRRVRRAAAHLKARQQAQPWALLEAASLALTRRQVLRRPCRLSRRAGRPQEAHRLPVRQHPRHRVRPAPASSITDE